MSRALCLKCHYPVKTCVCSSVSEIGCTTKIIILQHPSESGHAKNTARLVPLVIPSAEIIIGENPDDFLTFSRQCELNNNVAVFYPAPKSVEFVQSANEEPLDTLIFLDGTWRKALKLWLLNPWLWSMPAYRIEPDEPSTYGIRKTKQANSLSTLEAISYALKLNEKLDTAPLIDLQQAMQCHWRDANQRGKTKSQ